MFDNPDDCNNHRDPSSVSVPPPRKPLSSPLRMSPQPCKDSMDKPVKGVHTPLGSKRVRTASSLSPTTPQNDTDKIRGRGKDRPRAKLAARFTRSMAKANSIKTPIVDKLQVETVVLDDEELDFSSPDNDNVVHSETVPNPVDKTPPVVNQDIPVLDKEVRADAVIHSPTK